MIPFTARALSFPTICPLLLPLQPMLLTCRRRCWTSLYTDGLLSSAYRRPYSTKQQRPYALNIGISYAGKPPYSKQKASKAHFPKESPIVKWRDQTLAGAVGQYKNAGEDFFFTQSVRFGFLLCTSMTYSSLLPDEGKLGIQSIQSLYTHCLTRTQGVAFGVADGVGGAFI